VSVAEEGNISTVY